ncbi:hypothetical protein HZC09_06345 [Candidatus Micrarchaeota archaeon]|nr:hypothetical protein [Candidatus Micrarchaeota archaeon]
MVKKLARMLHETGTVKENFLTAFIGGQILNHSQSYKTTFSTEPVEFGIFIEERHQRLCFPPTHDVLVF